MDDLDFDRELHAALDIAPSPEFVARVRVAIAQRPVRRSVPGWLTAVAGIASIVVAVFAANTLRPAAPLDAGRETPPAPAISPALVPDRRAETTTPNNLPSPTVADASLRPNRSRSVVVGQNTPAMPEVLVAAADKRAFEEFVAAIHQHRFAATFEETPVSAPFVLTELAISPIAIEPLADAQSTDGSAPVHN